MRAPEDVKAIVDKLKQDFDYVVIDCPAGIDEDSRMLSPVLTKRSLSRPLRMQPCVMRIELSGFSKARTSLSRS